MKVNGKAYDRLSDPETPVLWILRDELGLLGTKYGCGLGVCGSCTIHLEGKPFRACITSAAQIGDQDVTTIEGLAQDENLHAVQQAWIDEEVAQCGYCQAGQIMAAVALLKATPRPTDAQIDEAMRDIICRCGTYTRIRRAIHRAARAGRR